MDNRRNSIKTSIAHEKLDQLESKCIDNDVNLITDSYGIYENPWTKQLEAVKRFLFTTKNRMSVEIITYGARLTSIRVPNIFGESDDILLGYDSLDAYMQADNIQFGSLMNFDCNAVEYSHFNRVNWAAHIYQNTVIMTYIFDLKSNGSNYPILIKCAFEVKRDNTLHLSYDIASTMPPLVNLDWNLFFQLNGHNSGHIYDQILSLNAFKYAVRDPIDKTKIQLKDMAESKCDLRTSADFGAIIARFNYKGIDQNFLVRKSRHQNIAFICRIFDPLSGRYLEVYGNEPIAKLYTANNWTKSNYDKDISKVSNHFKKIVSLRPSDRDRQKNLHVNNTLSVEPQKMYGKGGVLYEKHGAFSINLLKHIDCVPVKDIVNNRNHTAIYKFGLSVVSTCNDVSHQ